EGRADEEQPPAPVLEIDDHGAERAERHPRHGERVRGERRPAELADRVGCEAPRLVGVRPLDAGERLRHLLAERSAVVLPCRDSTHWSIVAAIITMPTPAAMSSQKWFPLAMTQNQTQVVQSVQRTRSGRLRTRVARAKPMMR